MLYIHADPLQEMRRWQGNKYEKKIIGKERTVEERA